tara:strand:- start:2135 stop:2425 length:291 start_codon:yes stop_codon:yes gene_type:complete
MVEPLGRTEQEYLELAETFKDRMAEKNKEYRDIKVKYILGKKLISQTYGLVRSIQTEMDADICDHILVEWLINEIRTIHSDYLFQDEEKKLGIYGE